MNLPVSLQTIGLLVASNIFMTFAWYGHLKNMAEKPWYVAALVSEGLLTRRKPVRRWLTRHRARREPPPRLGVWAR